MIKTSVPLTARPGYHDELARWTGRRTGRDGVPAWAAGPWDALEVVPSRDFTELSSLPGRGRRSSPIR